MKKLLFLALLFPSIFLGQKFKIEKSHLIIPSKQIVRVDYPLYKGYSVKIWNKSNFDIDVSTHNRNTDSLSKDLVVEKKSSIQITIDKAMYLQFTNRFLTSLKIEYTLEKGNLAIKKKRKVLTPQRAFYLENNTSQILQLHIPGVINPKLNPFTRSGVDLQNGQKVYLKMMDEKLLILTVTDRISNGDRFDLATLINKALNNK